ncbi:ferric iron uptake transcriptional regulator [Neptunomonas phycophila]|jgi:Fur family ferric uptake transcriptional regulator|uniref:Ferric uptake regulation protein n=1 Tax=Neptunomonas phycophila TaxID=1572645 RepID=A0AAW7XIK0_9GAMM|nr:MULTISPECIES: ferric iron uptake transcriptional regulator [Neptunomonas]MBT3144765.1 ferric iron uptake transcriptional regulator [Neptunomonas phycophila]MDN2660905.1 ferric iron uptake transcriptional regulator [Neptunomonas sp. CHC150]MDO6453845.1 ferric iron uptake transcriptional regulator [Neptunomonas phycophila]MDO6467844.1 ferric iron uptake transcriptional regulator [Neptunomonas phycophila]MDO6783888.1 ferric iron uptake transcriptional regulator [Neptunomonas phycophila]
MSLENQELRKAGLKVTLPRVKIYQILEKAGEGDHFSAEDIYKLLMGMGEDVGLATVYRVLTQFEAAGLVSRHHFEGGHSVFELAREEEHDHIVCVKCGHVREFTDPVLIERQNEIAKELGFNITDRTLYLYGVCADGCVES